MVEYHNVRANCFPCTPATCPAFRVPAELVVRTTNDSVQHSNVCNTNEARKNNNIINTLRCSCCCCLLMLFILVVAIFITFITIIWWLDKQQAASHATQFLESWKLRSATTVTPNITNQKITLETLTSILNSTLDKSNQVLLIQFQKIAQAAIDAAMPKLKQNISYDINKVLSQRVFKNDARANNINIENINQDETQGNYMEKPENMLENENIDLEYGFGIIRDGKRGKRKHKALDIKSLLKHRENLINELKETNLKVERLENQNNKLQMRLQEEQVHHLYHMPENLNGNIQRMHYDNTDADDDDLDDPAQGLVVIQPDNQGFLKYEAKYLIFI